MSVEGRKVSEREEGEGETIYSLMIIVADAALLDIT